jgi:hypothetical protein
MKMFAWLGRWTRGWHKAAEDSAELAPAFDEDRSSMAEFVRILSRIDRSDAPRASH